MAYKPHSWVITKQLAQTFAIRDKDGEIATTPPMGESDAIYELYKTDDAGLRADAKWGIREFRSFGDARRALANLIHADERNIDPDFLCPYCGNDLSAEMGEDLSFSRVIYQDGGHAHEEFGDVNHYFCPECGRKLSDAFANNIYEKFYE